MFNIVIFIKESYREIRHKMSWPSYEQLQELVFWFFVLLAVWTIFLFGVSQFGRFLQEIVYNWLKVGEKTTK